MEPSLFEPFRQTPTLAKVRECLRKQLNWHHELGRRARARSDSDPEAPSESAVSFPALVVIGPGRPQTVLRSYGCRQVQPGVYHALPGLAMRVVVLAELPQTRETLLLRLLGTGALLRQVLADLESLPKDAWEKSIAEPLLLHFGLLHEEDAPIEEEDMRPEIQAWYQDYQKKQQKLRDDARIEGHREGERDVLLRLLAARFGELPEDTIARIEAADEDELDKWTKRVLRAQTLAEVLDDPS